MEKQKRLILIDGHAILHRAFHALPPLTTSRGQEVGAVFGFCSMLLRVIQDLKSDYLAVAFDLPKPTFRQKLYANYQAQRPQMAEELSSQVEVVHRVLETMKIPIFEKEGYEADDVIGTIARQASQDTKILRDKDTKKKEKKSPNILISQYPNIETIIVTGDRDMLQLVGEKVKVYAPIKGITQTILYDEKLVKEKYGLKPSQWVDYKALIGDPSDNYPGVAGIGPKTATDLLKEYVTLKKVYQNLHKLPERQARVLEEGRKQVELAKQLATLVTDVSLEFDLEECKLKDLKNPTVEKLFEELEFKSLIARLGGEKPKNQAEEKSPKKENTDQLKLI